MNMQTHSPTADQTFHKAIELHQAGRIAEAENIYRQVLTVQPENPGAVFLFGLCHHQRGDHESAITLMDIAINMNPAMQQAHYNRGLALHEIGRYDEAIASYDKAIELQASYAQAFNNRGNTQKHLGRLGHALASYDQAIELVADFAEAHTNRGNVLKDLTRLDEALLSHQRAIKLKPDYAEAYFNQGNALRGLKRPRDAVESYDRAIALKPDYVEAYIYRADTLHELDCKDEAFASYSQAIELKPDSAQAYEMRGNLLMAVKHYGEACADLEMASQLDDKLLTAQGQLVHAKMLLSDWDGLPSLLGKVYAGVERGEAAVTPFAALSVMPSAALQQAAIKKIVDECYPSATFPRWTGQRYAHDRIRVAYFSSDFRNHAVAYLTAGLFESHDRSQFELFGFYLGPETDDASHHRVKQAFEHFFPVREKSDSEIAQLAKHLEIDIAIDLNGLTEGGRLDVFAQRPAPVQVSYLGYPGTSGTSYIDYIIADRIVIPPETQAHFSEKTVWLPHSFQVNDDKKVISETLFSRSELGLPENGFVFCCFNNSYKITPDLFDIWMRLLQKVEGSILWLSEANETSKANLLKEANKRQIASERLVFAKRQPLADYLANYRQADLFLDTFCYNAGTTASDALWAGLPVLTRLGETFAQRMAGSLLNAIGLPGLITQSHQAYEALAIELATNPDRLREIRRRLGANRATHPLFDTAGFTRSLEQAYVAMKQRTDAGQPPDHIELSA